MQFLHVPLFMLVAHGRVRVGKMDGLLHGTNMSCAMSHPRATVSGWQ
ncbi:hypothetical protein CUPL110328_02440 [Cupriavidus plantarum]|uniref:Uncharacterized protein n=1 Tax=Cupriavidus plantarum TaxID=942865 RepID=A0A316EUL4_9BURK|nr:hypothetical protein C7419_102121 [Cupriavidus plantarum]RLK38721.1 hypothetical protein C7417_2243 [Cupriavidus plantarum]CAG2137626.1 hypothetical protein LMG26296_02572 [Cupriavidus plantarum]SMR84947.1 hypothetical protein SAMN05421735_3742 [Cupriavidus plantarum]